MERIKQAIEKVKREQGGVSVASESRPAAVASQHPSADQVSYSRTRVIELNLLHLEKHRIVAFNKHDPMSISFDVLRTQVLRKMDEKAWRTLAVTSPTPGCGKTVVAINLAMSIAHQTNKTAMLVDFDLRRPKVASYLGLAAETSLNDVIAGKAALPDALINPDIPRLVVLPTRRPEPTPAEKLASKQVKGLIRDLRERYVDRTVLIDLPPLLGTDDAMSILPEVDGVLVVVGNGMATKAEINDTLRHLPAGKLVGVVLNKGEQAQNKYY